MGNQQNKLERKFSSMPAQTFPSPKQESSFVRKIVRAAKRRQHELGIGKSREYRVPFTEALFLPEYPLKGDAEETDFEILEVIAKGAFGNVMMVRKKDNKVIYAIKVMKKSQVIVDGAVQQCKDEATIQDAVGHHPFIVKPYYYFQNKENVYIVMEYIPRGELFAAWRHYQCFSEALVRLYIAELALVLDFLHKSEIIYRDLKMENILIDVQGHLQVIDFGLAKWLKKGARTKTICGTLQYIAPEVLSTQPYGHSADWWSLGILMYTLLVGEYPVSGAKNHFEMAKMIQDRMYEVPKQLTVSWNARDCCRNLLMRDPVQRLQSLDELQKEPFFRNLDFDALVNRQISPGMYMESQECFRSSFHEPETPIGNGTKSRSLDDLDPDDEFEINYSVAWNESVASLDASFV